MSSIIQTLPASCIDGNWLGREISFDFDYPRGARAVVTGTLSLVYHAPDKVSLHMGATSPYDMFLVAPTTMVTLRDGGQK